VVNLRVVDIYHGDRVSSFKKAADFGIWGIIHKLGHVLALAICG
jgi:hypothetical protein